MGTPVVDTDQFNGLGTLGRDQLFLQWNRKVVFVFAGEVVPRIITDENFICVMIDIYSGRNSRRLHHCPALLIRTISKEVFIGFQKPQCRKPFCSGEGILCSVHHQTYLSAKPIKNLALSQTPKVTGEVMNKTRMFGGRDVHERTILLFSLF